MERTGARDLARDGIGPFLEYLGKHTEDRGVMADLRHGFSEATEYRAWPHIAPWCDLRDERVRRIMVTVSAGFALHKLTVPGGNMGAVLRAIAMGDGRGVDGLSTFDGRFRRLLACATAIELCDHLPGVLKAAERRGVAVDFARLHDDLVHWGERRKVEWAQEYWGADSDEGVAAEESEADEAVEEAP